MATIKPWKGALDTARGGNGMQLNAPAQAMAKAARILPDLAQQEAQELAMLRAERDRLIDENEALKAKPRSGRPFRMKVGEKRGVSVYGYGRFPVTLFATAWLDILDNHADEIKAFIQANRSALSWGKDD